MVRRVTKRVGVVPKFWKKYTVLLSTVGLILCTLADLAEVLVDYLPYYVIKELPFGTSIGTVVFLLILIVRIVRILPKDNSDESK